MKYMGSKARLAKDILKVVLRGRQQEQWYVEPFAGGCNMLDKVDGNRIGNDSNEYIISIFKAMDRGWTPPETVSKEEYAFVRDNKDSLPKELVGYVGICCSYSGKWFGGYAGKTNTREGVRDYQDEARRALLRQHAYLRGVLWSSGDYSTLDIPPKSIVYCDPPYANTTGYKDSFDSESFWEWCRRMSKIGHQVYVSEYTAPGDFKCVWEKTVKSSLSANGVAGGSKESVECLFVPC
jgi:DNA adenine methylase